LKSQAYRKIALRLWIALLAISCKQNYEPDIPKSKTTLLVVDGFLNAGGDTTVITLSHTASLYDTVVRFPERAAQVIIEDANAQSYPLFEKENGIYSAALPSLNTNNTYRIKITLADGRLYSSDLIPVKVSPAIDSLTWREDSIGLSVYLNTHDALNKSHNYRWEYEETWEYRSAVNSLFDWINSEMVSRPLVNQVYYCWRSFVSNDLLLGSSAKLTQDVISNVHITSVEKGSEKLSNLYSILVKQYCLTDEAFEYIRNLKKNTEQTGSIADAQPTELISNIHSVTNPREPVIGYFTACVAATKRLFISDHEVQLPKWTYFPYYVSYTCKSGVYTTSQMDSIFLGPGKNEWVAIGVPPMSPPGFYVVNSANCADCRYHGGINVKPSFWP
jgi:hypothetical protein